MRIAFVDLLFSWPPHGGADVDLFHTAGGLQGVGHDVHLFVASQEDSWERGSLEPSNLPFPATVVPVGEKLDGPKLGADFRAEVDSWKPDAVFIGDGFFLKPFVIEALAAYPTVGRYYAHEAACLRDILRFKDGAPCPSDYVRTPNVCRRCAVTGMRGEITSGRRLVWTQEFLAAKAYLPSYHVRFVNALKSLDGIIVYNEAMKGHLADLNANVHVIPGGVNIDQYESEESRREEPNRKVILMAGRVEDPLKGLSTLLEAGERLASKRTDFEIRATHTDQSLNSDWFKAIGWRDHDAMRTCYRESDICVVPSIWEEPFGLVAVEAMACGRPVCASRVGGLQSIVVDGETGYLFDRTDSGRLAERLEMLLEDDDLRRRMGEAGRRRAEKEYDWAGIVERYYPKVWESIGL